MAAVRRLQSRGAAFPLHRIADADRINAIKATLAYGNHKSAKIHEAKLIEMLDDEVEKGWQLPLPPDAALDHQGTKLHHWEWRYTRAQY